VTTCVTRARVTMSRGGVTVATAAVSRVTTGERDRQARGVTRE
jgi:hypothetical protein